MKDIAEIVKVTMYGNTCYQVNILNARTGMYYNSSSRYFDSKKGGYRICKRKRINNKKLIDMNSKVWFVVRENLVWKYCPDFNCSLWVTVSNKRII